MPVHHRIFGLGLTAPTALPLLDPAPHADAANRVVVRAGVVGAPVTGAPLASLARLSAVRDLADGALHLDYGEGLHFRISADASEVVVPPGATAMHYLLGPILGCVLRLRSVTCLHASAVVRDARAVLLLGSRGAGKSTTAAALAARGLPALTDDVAAIDAGGHGLTCHPGYPGLRLWPEAARSLGFDPDRLTELRPGAGKRYLDLRGAGLGFADAPVPIAEIWLLAPGDGAPGSVETFAKRPGLLALLGHVHARDVPGLEPGAADFERLGTLAEAVPIRRIATGSGLADLARVADAILASPAGDTDDGAPAPRSADPALRVSS